ncbi:MAG: hypothetical protein CBB87_04760 [Micavibrio sp. TMED27]|nr:hypothetical protein [Micavibrio sp.]OUT91344.1 MAG: hypothetical protein CBB87_04760 [Micavibrio sp. TMED27]
MGNHNLIVPRQYFDGNFKKPNNLSKELSLDEFQAIDQRFQRGFNDFYLPHYNHYKNKIAPTVVLPQLANVAMRQELEHMRTLYIPCAISSGEEAHIRAVKEAHYTTDKLAGKIGSSLHNRIIAGNGSRGLQRATQMQKHFPEYYLITPSSFEGATRNLIARENQADSQTVLPPKMSYGGAAYMANWYMTMAMCNAFAMDDPKLERRSTEDIESEIHNAQAYSHLAAKIYHGVKSTNWADSRSSISENAYGNYIRFGLHPLRQDADLSMYIYDEATDRAYDATLLDCFKPVVQNLVRWSPQGIATEEAATTAARYIHLHRMRTEPEYNKRQPLPLDLTKLPEVLRNPTQEEIHEMNRLIEIVEPFLLEDAAHLIQTGGLPKIYEKAKNEHPFQIRYRGNDIIETNGNKLVKWQRTNISAQKALDIYEKTALHKFDHTKAKPLRQPLHGKYTPQRRKHSYNPEEGPFTPPPQDEIWQDNPFQELSGMEKTLLKFVMGALETGMTPLDMPEFHGVRYDLKRGEPALKAAKKHKVQNLELLPGVLGKEFKKQVGDENYKTLLETIERLKYTEGENGESIPRTVFSTHHVKEISNTIAQILPDLPGPGPKAMSSTWRLALEMEMMRRNYTHITFQKNWETSEDSARIMLQATKIEMGQVKRPGDNHSELSVLNEKGEYISFFDRYNALRSELIRIHNDPVFQKKVTEGDVQQLQKSRHLSVALARMIEIYDCLQDPDFNTGKFDPQKVESQAEFVSNLRQISETRQETLDLIKNQYVWTWSNEDLYSLRNDYETKWLEKHGEMSRHVGPAYTDDTAIHNTYGR